MYQKLVMEKSKGIWNISKTIGPINPTEENQGSYEVHGPERMGNNMDWTMWIGVDQEENQEEIR